MQTRKDWHLARNENSANVTEFELQLRRVYYGFLRWQEGCERSVNTTAKLTGDELSILHIIRMQDKPKSISDIGRLLNRDDTFNIKYSVQKLLKLSLIEKVTKKPDLKILYYQATQLGKENTEQYAKAREMMLIDLFKEAPKLNLPFITKTLSKIKSIYDEADDRSVANYLNTEKEPDPKA